MNNDIHLHQKITIDSYLSECSFHEATKLLPNSEIPDTIYISPTDMIKAGRLAHQYGLRVIVLPMLPIDSWAISSEYRIIYSPGA